MTTFDAKTFKAGQYKPGDAVVRRRPYRAPGQPIAVEWAQDGTECVVADYTILNTVDLKCFHCSAEDGTCLRQGSTTAHVAFRSFHMNRCFVKHPRKVTPSLHIDAMKFESTGNPGEATDVLIENGAIEDCGNGVMVIHIVDGFQWGNIIIRDMNFAGNVHPIYLGGKSSRFKSILFERCNGLRAVLQGQPGSMPSVIVKDCPGASVTNSAETSGGPTPQANIQIITTAPPVVVCTGFIQQFSDGTTKTFESWGSTDATLTGTEIHPSPMTFRKKV